MRFAAWCWLIVVLASDRGFAQSAGRISDTELRAAYCLGVATSQVESASVQLEEYRSQLKVGRISPDTVTLMENIVGTVIERRDRLRDYLRAKDTTEARSANALRMTLSRGAKDALQCHSDANAPYYKNCTQRCRPMDTVDDRRRCDEKCSPSEPCIRVKRCLEQFLPF
jgi:hypothetical protein